MKLLRWTILLQFTTILAFGQPVHQGEPPRPSEQPEAMVRSLYKAVVARQPIGIPESSASKLFFAPYLSKGLLHRIDLALACGEDWHRKNPDPNLKPEVGWLELGLFSGDSEEAEPRAFHIERTQTEKDGSFRVYVRLTWGGPPESTLIWHVAAVVVRENGQFVVDDVLYLKDDGPDVESRLSVRLSAGCDGSHWIGFGKQQGDPKQQR